MKKFLRIVMYALIVAMLTSTITLIAYYTGDSDDKIHFSDDTKETKKSTQKTEASSKEIAKDTEEVKWTHSDTPIYFPILMYHHIADVVDGNTLYVPEDEFRMEMQALKDAGYYTLSPEEAYRVLTKNESPAEKIVWITFDDGYMNNYQAAVPILTELEMKGTINIISSANDGVDYISNEQLLELNKNPLISLQSHTVSHLDLSGLDFDSQTSELSDSRQSISELLGKDITSICYPSGRYNDETLSIAETSGYKLGLTTNGGLASSNDGLYSLNRVRISYGHSKDTFLNQISPEMWGVA